MFGFIGPVVLAATVSVSLAPTTSDRSAFPAEDVILDLFRDHPVVLFGEMHNSAELHAFLRSLVTHPRFTETVQDVVLEALNVKYQPLLDRYVAGEDVPRDSVALAWRNSTQLLLWDSPLYVQLLDVIRQINTQVPAERRVRVLASDPPVAWDSIQEPADFPRAYGYRDWQTADVIRSEVLAHGRHALVVIGGTHVFKKSPSIPGVPPDPIQENVAAALERTHPGVVYSIESVVGGSRTAVAARIPTSTRPYTLLKLAGSGMEQLGGSILFGNNVTLFRMVNGQRESVAITADMMPPLGEVIDAFFYVGQYSNPVPLDVSPYLENAELLAALRRRIALMHGVYGVDIWTEGLDRALRAAGGMN